jgi:hypothetical protein
MVPISDGNLVPEIAQVAEGLEFIDGHAIPLENSKKRVWAVCIPPKFFLITQLHGRFLA